MVERGNAGRRRREHAVLRAGFGGSLMPNRGPDPDPRSWVLRTCIYLCTYIGRDEKCECEQEKNEKRQALLYVYLLAEKE